MTNALEVLKDVLAAEARDWDHADRELALTIGADITTLMSRDLAGENVASELKLANAAANNLAVGAAVSGANVISAWLDRLFSLLLRAAVSG